jgi:hypothetical protein
VEAYNTMKKNTEVNVEKTTYIVMSQDQNAGQNNNIMVGMIAVIIPTYAQIILYNKDNNKEAICAYVGIITAITVI